MNSQLLGCWHSFQLPAVVPGLYLLKELYFEQLRMSFQKVIRLFKRALLCISQVVDKIFFLLLELFSTAL